MNEYLKRLAELVVVTFLGGAVPVLLSGGLSKAAVAGALSAGVAAVYGVMAKRVGDKERPTVS